MIGWLTAVVLQGATLLAGAEAGRDLPVSELGVEPRSFRGETDASGSFVWWLPEKADGFVLPFSAGIRVETANASLMQWLKEGSPWELLELPVFGVRYGDRTAVVIVPWPHYAELVVGDRVGVRFKFPPGREKTTPCEIVALWQGADPMEVAAAFRRWRSTAVDTGAIPKPRSLVEKVAILPAVDRLFGAPHFYLWGPALFSPHDVDKKQWAALARALLEAAPGTFPAKLTATFPTAQRQSLTALASSAWAENYLIQEVAAGIDHALQDRSLPGLPPDTPQAETVRSNSLALAKSMQGLVHDPVTWGDGGSVPMLESLKAAGVDRAVLLLSDFYGNSPRPDVAAKARELGYLLGPYDSYHSIHDPRAAPDKTWETAQFDQPAYETGRVINADGSGHAGFKGRGYHFAPAAAWPYLQRRVQSAMGQVPFTAWFMDCDATAESFDDFDPRHPATKVEDARLRRERLDWLVSKQKLVLGSEGGSVLFADLIHFGHGPQTPYLGHLAAEFKDPASASFMGKYWPADAPAYFFKSIASPSSLITPYFDPSVRIPLYRAALGDEVIPSHHWCFDSFKLSDVASVRELMEILHMVPPMYHVNRGTWPQRKARILRHYRFWSPLHRQLATAPLVHYECLTVDRLVQRSTFQTPAGKVSLTVNFGTSDWQDFPMQSATVSGEIQVGLRVYQVKAE